MQHPVPDSNNGIRPAPQKGSTRSKYMIFKFMVVLEIYGQPTRAKALAYLEECLTVYELAMVEPDQDRPTLNQVKVAMEWWNTLSPLAKQMYRAEYPQQLDDALSIARFWARMFPATSKDHL